jgi:hypothetical protein
MVMMMMTHVVLCHMMMMRVYFPPVVACGEQIQVYRDR